MPSGRSLSEESVMTPLLSMEIVRSSEWVLSRRCFVGFAGARPPWL